MSNAAQKVDLNKVRNYLIARIEKQSEGKLLSDKEIAVAVEYLLQHAKLTLDEDTLFEVYQNVVAILKQRHAQRMEAVEPMAHPDTGALPQVGAPASSEPEPEPDPEPEPQAAQPPPPKPPAAEPAQIAVQPSSEVVLQGFGAIQVLLDDPDVSEVMVNGPYNIYVEKEGRLQKSEVTFENNAAVEKVIQRIVKPLGRIIDADHPTVDARLPDGSRVNAVVPPVAIDGASITIRKFAKDRLGINDLVNFNSLTPEMGEFLEACVKAHLNVVVSGGTGSGKTTLLNILSSFIPDEERIVTIEDAAELQMQQDHVVRLETKAPNLQGTGEVTIRDLVKNSLRMRPDRIVIGEVRGGEALDMLQAMNTGHDGSLTTVHSNSPRDAVARLETLVMMAGMDLPLSVVRQQIASAVDLIVQQSRLSDGARKVTYITEIAGMEGERVVLTDVFKYEQEGTTTEGKIIGEHLPSGIRPMFMNRLVAAGFDLPATVFIPKKKKKD